MRPAIFLLLLALTCRLAHSAAGVGVIVTGEPALQASVLTQVQGWLQERGYELVAAPFEPAAANTFTDCFIIEDMACARGVFESRARPDNVVLVRVSLEPGDARDVVLTAYWLVKGHDAAVGARTCPACDDVALHRTIAEMLDALVEDSGLRKGRLVLDSKPSGLIVVIDGTKVGATPIARDVPPGSREIVLLYGGRAVARRTLEIEAGASAELVMTARLEDAQPRSRVLPGLALGLGVAAIGAGAALYLTSETDDGSKLYYRETRPLGLGLAAGGTVLTAVGAWLWIRSGSRHAAPIASIGPTGGIVGWARAF
jgi:hypothetical protein